MDVYFKLLKGNQNKNVFFTKNNKKYENLPYIHSKKFHHQVFSDNWNLINSQLYHKYFLGG